MVVGESPEWLPPGFTVKIKYNDGRKIKYYFNVATGKKYYSKNEVIRCATECNSLLVTPQTKNADDRPSSIVKVDSVTISDNTKDSAAWLPSGWKVQERRRMSGSSQGSPYKVYTELSTGSKFYSKAAATRYLNTIAHSDTTTKQNIIDNVDEPLPDKSLQVLPLTNTSRIHEKERNGNSLLKIDNVDEPVPEKLPQIISIANSDDAHDQRSKENCLVQIDNVGETLPDMSPLVKFTTNTDGIVVKKRKGSSFVTVAIERTTADGLPAGWIKEIRTSKSGQKIRKDPFYTDPVSGYEFRSRPDALRYLKTNDISSCACRPLKREDGMKLIEKKDPTSNQATQKLSTQNRELFLGEESNGGAESSGTKNPPDTDTKTLKHKQTQVTPVGALFIQEKVSSVNSNENANMGNDTQAENDVSKEENIAVAVDVAMCSTPMTESGGRSNLGSRKSKKRRNSSLPLRTSKRLAGSEPEIQSNLDLNERSLRAAVSGSTVCEVETSPNFPLEASDIRRTSNIEPPKEAHTVISEETHQDDDQLKEVEKPPADIPQTSNIEPPKEPTYHTVRNEETLQDIKQLKEVERPPTEGSPIPEEQPVAKESQEKEHCYDFGESWSDPLEFALKTLRGEIPIDDTLTFPSFFGDGCLKQSDFNVPTNFQSEFAPNSESLKKKNAVDPSPATSSPSFSTLGNAGFNSCVGFNFQPSSEVRKKDSQSQTKLNP